jgi:hypothetical protein
VSGDRHKQRYHEQGCEPKGISHLKILGARRARRTERAADRPKEKCSPLIAACYAMRSMFDVAVSRWVSSSSGLPLDEKNRYNLPNV